MQELKDHINRQFAFNNGKNLYYKNADQTFKFIDNTDSLVNLLPGTDENKLLDYVTDKALVEFYNANQYYTFNAEAQKQLKNIYSDLLRALKSKCNQDELSAKHYGRLRSWLQATNPFSTKVNDKNTPMTQFIACEEYSPGLQISILNIDPSELIEPVLDIGCGKEARLVSNLREMGIEIYGIDRIQPDSCYCSKHDWLDYDPGTQKWGTIISNLGFTNHFKHHHLRVDGDYITYARKYMAILHSLKPGGSFIYAPAVPFIENFLDNSFRVKRISIQGTDYQSVSITKTR